MRSVRSCSRSQAVMRVLGKQPVGMSGFSLPASRSMKPVPTFDGVGCAGCGVETSRRWIFTPVGMQQMASAARLRH